MQAQDAADEAAATRAIERDMQLYNEMAEGTVLAALLRASPSLPDDLDPNIFYREQHRLVAERAIMLRESGREPDMVTLVDDLIEHGQLEAAGGSVYVSRLYEARPMSTETTAALTIVQRDYYRRRCEETQHKLVNAFAQGRYGDGERLLGEVKYWEELQAGAATAARPTRFRFLTVDDLRKTKPAKGIIGDILYEHTTGYLYGHSNRWKSFVAFGMCLCVATGEDWLGRAVKQGRVVYVASEGEYGAGKRQRAWEIRHPHVRDYSLFHLVPEPVNLMDPDQVRDFIADLKTTGDPPSLIFFDTLASSMVGGDENVTRDAIIVTDALRRVRSAFGSCVMCVAHTGKDEGKGLRGSSALFGGADTVIRVNGKEGLGRIEPGETIKLISEKPKDTGYFDDIILTAEKVSWPVDEQGQEWDSSLVIVGTDKASGGATTPPKLPQSSLTALSALSGATFGLRSMEWLHASGLKRATFMQHARPDLLGRGFVCEVNGAYRLTDSGTAYLSGGRVIPFRPA